MGLGPLQRASNLTAHVTAIICNNKVKIASQFKLNFKLRSILRYYFALHPSESVSTVGVQWFFV